MTKAEKIQRIAFQQLGLPTLETRGRDSLDFPDVSVAAIKRALEAAYAAGQRDPVHRRPKAKQ